MPISDDELGSLLTDSSCPSAVLFGTKGDATIRVEAAVAFVEARHPDADDIEAQIDSFVERNGGRKQGTLHLNDLGRNLVARLRGRSRPSGAVLYVIPARVFEDRGRQPQSAVLPPAD